MKKVVLTVAAVVGAAAGVAIWKRRGHSAAVASTADSWADSVSAIADRAARADSDTAAEAAETASVADADVDVAPKPKRTRKAAAPTDAGV